MAHPLEHRTSNPDHMESGDVIAVRISIDQVPGIGTRVVGDIDDLGWTREALLAAKRTLTKYHAKKKVTPPAPGVTCAKHLAIVVRAGGSMSVTGDIGDLRLALAAIDNGLEAIKSESGRRAHEAILLAKDANL